MIRILRTRLKHGRRTLKFPDPNLPLPPDFRGKPIIQTTCAQCMKCLECCPVSCIQKNSNSISIDAGICIFCGKCSESCPESAIKFSKEYSFYSFSRQGLSITSNQKEKEELLKKEIFKLFGRSLKLREVSAGGCNACEADTNVLGTPAWDLGRFGIQFVASPRHADGILVTGPVPRNMLLALKKTYEAVPPPKVVIAVGACAISGGIFKDSEEECFGVDKHLPVDLYIPGCPPHPATILDGLLRLLGKINDKEF